MVMLKYLCALPLMAMFLVGCKSTHPTSLGPKAQENIAWIKQQFKICSGMDCTQPTRKTLAMVELPIPRKKVAHLIAEVPKTAPPSVPSDETVTARVHFDYRMDIPSTDGLQVLNKIFALAEQAKHIELEGRTDDLGGKIFNDHLAQRRAEFVRSWLVKQGVKAEIVVRSEGLCCYLDTATTLEARRNNRRVEVRLVIRHDVVSNSKGAQ